MNTMFKVDIVKTLLSIVPNQKRRYAMNTIFKVDVVKTSIFIVPNQKRRYAMNTMFKVDVVKTSSLASILHTSVHYRELETMISPRIYVTRTSRVMTPKTPSRPKALVSAIAPLGQLGTLLDIKTPFYLTWL